jgi:hypothetical protein
LNPFHSVHRGKEIAMQALHHVENAIHHAQCLADEAEDLNLVTMAKTLRHMAKVVSEQLELALVGMDQVVEIKKARNLAQDLLGAAYGALSCRVAESLPEQDAQCLVPTGHLNVAERTRFRLRRLGAMNKTDAVQDLIVEHERALKDYERAVDRYLITCTEANRNRQMAVAKSQLLRMELETAKKRLLAQAKLGGDAYQRIKRRAVRTKKPNWLDREVRKAWQLQIQEVKRAA